LSAATEPNGPLVQSISIAFKVAVFATVLLALAWLASDIREIPADNTAVVTRFGRIVDIKSAGLLLALPRPIEAVRLLPGPDRQISLSIEPQPPAAGLEGGQDQRRPPPRISPNPQYGAAGSYLTGDGGVVLLNVSVTYQITDPSAFMLAEAHIAPALNRIFRATAVTVAARHPLDDFLVVDQARAAATRATASTALRDEMLIDMNARLAGFGGMGVAVTRIDLTASLPTIARGAFELVLTAGQQAEQQIAMARTDVTRRQQESDQERDNLLNSARARAAERVTKAHTETDEILALQKRFVPGTRENLLDEIYRDRMAKLVPTIGKLTAVDPRGDVRLILPGETK
jgi:regulator of protease activity HflC (stomatin/prohibitin superfamily)